MTISRPPNTERFLNRLLSELKLRLVPGGYKPRKILTGAFKGIVMSLDLKRQTQLYLGLWEREPCSWLKRLSRGISTAIDIGAAQGEYTLFFLTKTKATNVYAFDPDAASRAMLDENLRLNCLTGSEKLTIVATFLGDSGADPGMRLDSLVGRISSPCLIKMDVDGAEMSILKGASELNCISGVRWLIETHSKELEAACVKHLSAAGYKTRIIRNAWWRIFAPECRPMAHNRWLAAWNS